MTADRLAARYDMGLEHDSRYARAIDAFCPLVTSPGVRTPILLDFLRTELPADQPDFAKVLFIEAVTRELGRRWEGDDCDFVDVTVAVARLQDIIRLLSFEFRSLHGDANLPFVVLATPYGEQHTLMPYLLGLLFDAMGWSTRIVEGADLRSPRLRSALDHADIVCIGWSNQRLRSEFHDLVAAVRSTQRDRRPPIIAGGIAALDSVDFLVSLGIDCICDSVYSAARICERFYELEAISRQARGSPRRTAVNASGIDWLTR
ncbi:cobalamin-binding protein [Ciceribacter sp. L1K23]|uniref:cobalamin B12-binding domain-containing protein n=1 Tax=Ciceribacter sp. L1K23 TaxID=2820276 RepID=UPI001B842EEC|nr:cobalamin-binding protein [Ciceribacter sp. L1K23]MBR0558362.1 cobalamin-binding protein [Ciceribacter sp. L1K23]